MAEDIPKYNPRFEAQAQGFAVGDNNIIYNYFGYTEESRLAPVDTADNNLQCPYRGLFNFSPNDAEYFFGRNVFVEKLFQATKNRNFIPVLGASGSGKSSVVLAGLVPKLEKEGNWKFTHFRPSSGNDPFYALAEALVPLYRSELDSTDRMTQAGKLAKSLSEVELSLAKVFSNIRRKYPNHKVLLIADQFEELYTQYSNPKFRRRFLDCLLTSFQSSNSGSSFSTVLVATMRADFLANVLSYPPFADMLQNVDIKLSAMNRKELTEVIEKPAQKLGVTFEAGLVERILDDVENEPGNLPLLEFALTELWTKRTGKQLTHNAYEAIGQVKGALADYADNKYKNLTAGEKEQARRIFIQLVRPGEGTEDTRRRTNRSELGEENWNLITRKDGLADSRLVVTGRNDTGQDTVEVVHEALIQNWGELRQWMETDREFRAWQERLRTTVHQWEDKHKDDGALLHGALLVEAELWQQQRLIELSPEERIFIQLSLALRDKEQTEREQQQQHELELERRARRMLQLLVGGLSTLLLASISIITYPYVLNWIARGEMVIIPAGPVIIGIDDQEAFKDEKPKWKTNLRRFKLERFEVSNSQYRLCVQAGKCTEPLRVEPLYYDTSTSASKHPVIGVTAEQAFSYCSWIGRRLPTELEWERAARGTDGRLWPWGNEPPTPNHANIMFAGEPEGTKPVKSYPKGASPEGVFNLIGNVWEWTASYGQFYRNYDQKLVWDGLRKNLRSEFGLVKRGGGWQDTHRRVTAKQVTRFFETNKSLGIRCASD